MKLLLLQVAARSRQSYGTGAKPRRRSDGLVVIAEFPDHESGAAFKETTDYKNALLAALDQQYTTPEAYEAAEKAFCDEVLQRDVRILGIPLRASQGN